MLISHSRKLGGHALKTLAADKSGNPGWINKRLHLASNGSAEPQRYHTRHLVPVVGEADGRTQIWRADGCSDIKRDDVTGKSRHGWLNKKLSKQNPDSVFSRLLLSYTRYHGETTSTGLVEACFPLTSEPLLHHVLVIRQLPGWVPGVGGVGGGGLEEQEEQEGGWRSRRGGGGAGRRAGGAGWRLEEQEGSWRSRRGAEGAGGGLKERGGARLWCKEVDRMT